MTAIAITCCQRFEVLRQCLQSLRACVGIEDVPVWLFPDNTGDVDCGVYRGILDGLDFPRAHMEPPPPARLHGDRNIIRARSFVFENTNADTVWTIDSDLVFSPWALRVMTAASTLAEALVCGIAFVGGAVEKEPVADAISAGMTTGTNLMLSRAAWVKIRGFLDNYAQRHLYHGGKEYLAKQMQQLPAGSFRRDFYAFGHGGSMHDAATEVALAVAGVPAYSTVVNRAVTIGVEGVTMTVEIFNKCILATTTLDVLASDEHRTTYRIL